MLRSREEYQRLLELDDGCCPEWLRLPDKEPIKGKPSTYRRLRLQLLAGP